MVSKFFKVVLALAVGTFLHGPLAAKAVAQVDEVLPVSLEGDAEAGDPMALFVAGRKHLIDAANTQDGESEVKGIEYLAQSAKLGFAPAARQIGEYLVEKERTTTARSVYWFEVAANAEDPTAQHFLGDAYRTGDGVDADPAQAVRWYRGLLDNPRASYENDRLWEVEITLAGLLANGATGTVDAKGALALWKHAATVGHAIKAQEELAGAYATGFGGKKNVKAAIKQYYAAAQDGLSHGYRYGMSKKETHAEIRRILTAMEYIAPKHKLTKALRKEVEKL